MNMPARAAAFAEKIAAGKSFNAGFIGWEALITALPGPDRGLSEKAALDQ